MAIAAAASSRPLNAPSLKVKYLVLRCSLKKLCTTQTARQNSAFGDVTRRSELTDDAFDSILLAEAANIPAALGDGSHAITEPIAHSRKCGPIPVSF
jgi:hypothetical protein